MNSQAKLTSEAATDGLLPRLKLETHSSHSTLESRIDLINLLKTDADYRRILEAFYGLISPIEARLEAHKAELAQWIPDLENRLRTEALRRDLQAVGNSSPQDLAIAEVPAYASVAEQIGCLYVLEGSTLGGQLISRHINQVLGFAPGRGCDFFSGHGGATGEMWQRFRNSVEAYASARPSEQPAVIESALRTFQTFDAWMRLRL